MGASSYHLGSRARNHRRRLLASGLQNRPEVLFAYLHGSFAEARPLRDVDMGVYLSPAGLAAGAVPAYEGTAALDLEALVGLPVDLKVLNLAPLSLRYHISRGYLLFSGDEPARYAFLEATWREYFDYYPLLREFYRDITA